MRLPMTLPAWHTLTATSMATLALFAWPMQAQAQTKSPWCASGKTVRFAGLNWESGSLLTELMRQIMEAGYGCKTDAIPGNTVTMETALASNDIQVLAEEWIGRSDAWNDAFKAGKVKAVGRVLAGATEGWYVPEYVVHGDARRGIKPMAPALKTVADLPRFKDLFKDEEEPAKGRFLNCPTGWTCEGVNSQKLKAYKLIDSYVNFRPGTGAALDAAIQSAVLRGKPIVFYYWNPTGLMGKYKFVRLQEPAYNEACFKSLADKNAAEPCGSASPEAVIQAGVSRAFHEADPALVDMLSKFNVPLPLLNKTLADMAEKKIDAKTAARELLKANPAVWKAWVPPDLEVRVAASLR